MQSPEPRTVLIVDDEAFFRSSVCEGISKRHGGLRLLSAGNGAEALEVLSREPVDLVVTDLKMPVLDGFGLLSRLIKDYPGVPAVVMTAFGTPTVEENVFNLGAVAYVEKPIDLESLGERIEQALRRDAWGHLKGITLFGFLQLLQIERKTCTLHVNSKGRSGLLQFEEGELVHAETGGTTGPAAVYLLETWEAPEIGIDNASRVKQRTIDIPLMQLLLEGARLADERDRDEGAMPVDTVPIGMPLDTVEIQPVQAEPVRTAPAAAGPAQWWERARRELGEANLPEIAFELEMAGGAARPLRGPSDLTAWSAPVLALTGSAASFCDEGLGTAELVAKGFGLGVVWETRLGAALVVAEPFQGRRTPTWFRSQLAAVARYAAAVQSGR